MPSAQRGCAAGGLRLPYTARGAWIRISTVPPSPVPYANRDKICGIRRGGKGDRHEGSQLELTAHQLGCRGLAARIAGTIPNRPWQTRWCHGRRVAGHQIITGHTGGVFAVSAGALPDGTPVIISGAGDGTVRVWRTADGTPVGEPLCGHDGRVYAVAAGALPDGTPVIISGGDDGTVRAWRLADGTPIGEPLRPDSYTGSMYAVAAGALPDGAPVIVSGHGSFSVFPGMLQVWRLTDGTPVRKPLAAHHGPVKAVAAGALPDGTPVIISGGGDDSTVRVWRLTDGIPAGEPLTRHDLPVEAVATGALPDGTSVIVSGGGDSYDAMVRVWRLTDGTPIGEPLMAESQNHIFPEWAMYPVYALATGALPDGTPVIISGGDVYGDSMVLVWRLADGTPVGEPLTGHDGRVYALAAGALPDGTPVIIGGCGHGFRDGTVRVWRLADGTPVGEPLTGHNGTVYAVAAGALPDGTPVIISGGDDGTAGANIAVHQPALPRPIR